jgi:hypothetical protein
MTYDLETILRPLLFGRWLTRASDIDVHLSVPRLSTDSTSEITESAPSIETGELIEEKVLDMQARVYDSVECGAGLRRRSAI